jgi:hypothetical protein
MSFINWLAGTSFGYGDVALLVLFGFVVWLSIEALRGDPKPIRARAEFVPVKVQKRTLGRRPTQLR